MIELYFLRHAHAGDPLTWTDRDEIRPLSDKGRKQADRLGRFLSSSGFAPDVFITSPKVRAQQTAEIVAGHLGVRVLVDDRLALGFGPDTVERILTDAGGPARPVLVGHDPDFTEIVALLAGAGEIPMKKGALARIDCDRPIEPGTGTLRWLVPPDLLSPGR